MKKRIITILLCCLCVAILMAYPSLFPEKTNQNEVKLFGSWNGFNNHLIVLECINTSSKDAVINMQLKNFSDEIIGEEELQLSGNGVSHTILNKFGVTNSYGTIALRTLNENSASCFTVTYRLSETQEVEYASSVPLGSTIRGISSGVFNSMNPDINIDNRTPVFNWLTIYNPGEKPFSATILVRDQSGNLLPEKSITLEGLDPGGRRDFALGHTDGEVVGIYQIIPSEPSQIYGSFLSRYSRESDNEYNFSIVIPSSAGALDSGMISASTMGPAYNWAEIVNIHDQPAEVLFEVFDRNGALLFSRNLTLEAFAQHHEFLNQFIGELNVGYFRVRGSLPLISQSFFYGTDGNPDNSVGWAYSVMGGKGFYQTEGTYPVNTNLGASNWLKIFADDEERPLTVELSLYDSSGEKIELGHSTPVVVHGSSDIAIHEFTGGNFTGNLHIKSNGPDRKFNAQVVRVFTNLNQNNQRSKKESFAELDMRELSEENTRRGRRGAGLISYILSVGLLNEDESNDDEDRGGESEQNFDQNQNEENENETTDDQFEEPIEENSGSTPHKKCCACFYQDRQDTSCEFLDPEVCENYVNESNPDEAWICNVNSSGQCTNTFQSNCEKNIITPDCDYGVILPTLAGDELNLQHDFPADCQETNIYYSGHGTSRMCPNYFENLQSVINSANNSCHIFTFDSLACQLFADFDSVQAHAEQICIQEGKSCNISANQCSGVIDVESDCEIPGTSTRITVCIEGGENPTPTYELPECPQQDTDCAFGINDNESQRCLKPGGDETTFTCCPSYGAISFDKNGNIVPILTGAEWTEGENCPEI